jgi:metal-sulfur cluster biosynthetic enzyme
MTSDDVLRALSNVQEPDLGKDLVTLNMVRDIAISMATMFRLQWCLPHRHVR